MAIGKLFKGYSTVGKVNVTSTILFDIELIKRDLLNHFSIKRGEKLENPNFGMFYKTKFHPLKNLHKVYILLQYLENNLLA